MKHKYAVLVSLLLIFISQFALVSQTNAMETIILEPIADATVSNSMEPCNVTELKVGRLNNTIWWITYIMFDLSNISYKTLEGLTLKLRVKDFMSDGMALVDVDTASAEWTEDEITWSNKPEPHIPLITEEINSLGWYTSDCSLAISHMKSKKLSFALHTNVPFPGPNLYVVFYSRESEHKPQLEVKYTPPPKIEPILIVAIAGISLSGVLYLAYRLRKRKTKP